MDLNHDKQIQSLLCYRYTIGQTSDSKVELCCAESSAVPDRGCPQPQRSEFFAEDQSFFDVGYQVVAAAAGDTRGPNRFERSN